MTGLKDNIINQSEHINKNSVDHKNIDHTKKEIYIPLLEMLNYLNTSIIVVIDYLIKRFINLKNHSYIWEQVPHIKDLNK